MIQDIAIELIKPNPWQPRFAFSESSVKELAENILKNGLLQPPIARSVDGHYELAFGHRRLAAWKLACPGKPFPVQVEEFTDTQMAMTAATENGQRLDMNQIERAASIVTLINDFDLSQIEAGRLYGLTSQGGVSNLIRLLDLPPAIKSRIIDGTLAERHARMLIPVAEYDPKAAIELAEKCVKEEDEDSKGRNLDYDIQRFFGKRGKSLDDAPWNDEYPDRPIQLLDYDIKRFKITNMLNILRCGKCQHCHKTRYRSHCMYAPCYEAKLDKWKEDELLRAAEALGLPAAVSGIYEGLQATVIFNGDEYSQEAKVKKLLESKPKHLCLVSYPASKGNCWGRQRVLGSKWVALASSNGKFIAETQADLQQRAAEMAAAAANRQPVVDHESANKREEHVERMVTRAAPVIAEALPANVALLDVLIELVTGVSISYEQRKRYDAGNAQVRRNILAEGIVNHCLFEENLDDKPEAALKRMQTMAQALKVKAPARDFWKTLADVTAEKPEPVKSKVKKPAAKKPTTKKR